MKMLRPCLRAQTAALLRDHLLEFMYRVKPSEFCRPCDIMGGTAGQHARHIHDHFVRLVDVVECNDASLVQYDIRARETKFETDLITARANVLDTMRRMEAIVEKSNLNSPIRVSFTIAGEEVEISSTVARECAFVVHHAFHHAASIKAIATNLGFAPACPDGFGIAPSTADYLAQNVRG